MGSAKAHPIVSQQSAATGNLNLPLYISMDPLSTLTLAEKYFRAASELSGLIVKSGNPLVVSVPGRLPTSAEVEEATRQNDSNIGIPCLFNFYHGIELCLKGHLTLQNPPLKQSGHKLTNLFSSLSSSEQNKAMLGEFSKWLPPDSKTQLGVFLQENNAKIDDWYQLLKYPEMMNANTIWHVSLKYGGQSALPFWESVQSSCSVFIRESPRCYTAARSV